jgi:hypothetical protein
MTKPKIAKRKTTKNGTTKIAEKKDNNGVRKSIEITIFISAGKSGYCVTVSAREGGWSVQYAEVIFRKGLAGPSSWRVLGKALRSFLLYGVLPSARVSHFMDAEVCLRTMRWLENPGTAFHSV